MSIIYAVYGAGGFGQQVLTFLKTQFVDEDINNIKFYYIDDNSQYKSINGDMVLAYTDFLNLKADKKFVNITIANSIVREKIAQTLIKSKIKIFSIISPQSLLLSQLNGNDALILSPFSVISCNVRIGKFCHIGFHSSISHDCILGDYVTIATGVRCNGNVHIEDHAYIGSGAVIKQGTLDQPLVIGKGAVIGMGAVVTKSVPAGVTVVGNPARILEKK